MLEHDKISSEINVLIINNSFDNCLVSNDPSHKERLNISYKKGNSMETFHPPLVRFHDDQEDHLMSILVHSRDNNMSPALEQRLRDFRFAQRKRQGKYGSVRPWGILGLYDHLTSIRTDIEWAEDAAWRREHQEPYLSWKDFEEAKDTGFNRPFFTYVVMFLCTICLVVSIGVNDWKIESLNVNPMIGPNSETLVDMGAKKTSLIVNDFQWYRLFTPMLLHAGLIHFFFNMFALWLIGSALERSHGFFATAGLFVIPAIGGTIMSAISLPEYISVGASGGIFGLIGACIADILSNWNLLFSTELNESDQGTRLRHMKVLLWLIFDIVINCLIGLTPFVDNFTHLGGMLLGFLIGLTTMERLSKAFFGVSTNCATYSRNIMVRCFGIILSLILLIVTVTILARSKGRRIPCQGCRYFSCVPFPFWAEEDKKWWYCDDCPLSRGLAHISNKTNYFTSIDITCPDGVIENINISGKGIKDKDWLQKKLPNFCRKHCENIFS